MTSHVELEKQLVDDPFNSKLRAQFARALVAVGELERATQQWRLVLKQDEGAHDAQLELVCCLLLLNQVEQARDAFETFKRSSDYAAALRRLEPSRMALLQQHQFGVGHAALQLVPGGAAVRPGEVVSISRSATVRFSDVAGMEDLKKVLRLRIIEPFANPGLFARFKRRSGGGVLLYGPPGCGKTLIARAIATECKASFTAVGISDILSMWIGESERNLAELFSKARSEKPAVIFFDELDALAFSRSKAQSDHTRTMVNEFLAQLDGLSGNNDGILVLGATNLPWDVDEAMKRPGRFDRQIFVPPPDKDARKKMFELKLRDVPCSALRYDALAELANTFSGADIDGAIELAKDAVLLRAMSGDESTRIGQADLEEALRETSPTTLDWLKTSRNLIKFGGAGKTYKDVEAYLRAHGLY